MRLPTDHETSPALTESATRRISALIAEGAVPSGSGLRLRVEGGGCSGFRYELALATSADPDEVAFGEAGGPALFVDPASLPFLAGARVDYHEALVGARFQVVNPTARSGCGCGMSFDV